MFFVIYLRWELRRRIRQAILIALGLALGIGLVVTVTAASAGVKKAQAQVLKSLYGVGTDITVTGKAPKPPTPGSGPPKNSQTFTVGPGGAQVCTNGKCHSAAGQTIDRLASVSYSPIGASEVAAIARLKDVKAAAGGLALDDNSITIPKNFGKPGSPLPTPNSFNVQGTDTSHLSLGPLSAGTITSGRSLRASDGDANVAVVDAGYAKSHKLKVGLTVSVVGHKFTVVGIVEQPQSGDPPVAYIPLARAQALGTSGPGTSKSLKGDVNAIYVTASSAADIPAVQHEISNLLPGATVTSASSLAKQVTGSLSSTARLANDLGRWLSILVLIAAFTMASLLTMAAVARRVREFGTLKALGWPTRRIVGQVMGESLTVGVIGGAAGVGLGFAGAAIITAVAPRLSATIASSTGQGVVSAGAAGGAGGGGPRIFSPAVSHTVAVPMSASVTVTALVAAVVLAVVGGLVAGSFGSWRIARLRPADALARVA